MLKRDHDIDVELVDGSYGEFTVIVDGEEIIGGGAMSFFTALPTLQKVCELVEEKLEETCVHRP